jgi:uncharacterized membrane protein
MNAADLASQLVEQKLAERRQAAEALRKKSRREAWCFFAAFIVFLFAFFILFALRGFDETLLQILAYTSLGIALAFLFLFAGAYSKLQSAEKELLLIDANQKK